MKELNITPAGSANFKDCTIFEKFSIPIENKSLIEISKLIASDKFKFEIDEIQSLISEGKLEQAKLKKQQLPAFTPSATFKERRLLTHIDQYNSFVHLDFDNLSPEQLESASEIISQIPYTFFFFRSPSGKGLKVFTEVTTGKDYHDIAYEQVKFHYENTTGLKADNKCKDITRLCFISYDPNLYSNMDYQKFEVNFPPIDELVHSNEDLKLQDIGFNDHQNIFQECKQFTEAKKKYEDGNRNEFIYTLASNCNRKGIPEEIASQLAQDNYDLPRMEIINTFRSAYTHHRHEFAKFAKSTKLQDTNGEPPQDEDDLTEDYLKNTPTIPDEVYEALPDLLKVGASVFIDKRKKDIFLTGAISLLSGCLPNVSGVYFQERVFPHLYAFIIAPAASGKGVLKNAKRLIEKYHKKILAQSREAHKKYEQELDAYKLIERTLKKGKSLPEKPEKPPFMVVIIPADCSKAKMIEHLKANDGNGIICENEADTLSGTKKHDWGDYSTILRLAFHHETISISRKDKDQFDEVDTPRIAVALTGTPSQAPRLLSSAEDGLFSRILYYAFKNSVVWQDPSPNHMNIVYNEHFDVLADEVIDLIGLLEKNPTTIELSSSQWEIINKEFPKMLLEVTTFTSEDAAGVVFRLGLILFRICMILSTLRKFENAETTEVITCTDEDFKTALLLIQTYLQHSLLMFQNLPNQSETIRFRSSDGKLKFYEALPMEFSRKEAIELGSTFKLSPRTVDEVLKSCLSSTLSKVKAGLYQKI